MSDKNNNKNSSNTRKLHNPKAHADAACIPSWLIQLPISHISLGAKLVYGRLAQWSSSKGTVHRSAQQLSHEVGMSQRVVERNLKELRDLGLIGTYRIKEGGVNHYEFYDHEWMHAEIHPNLGYQTETEPYDRNCQNHTSRVSVPPVPDCVPPTPNVSYLKEKEIKRNKNLKDIRTPSDVAVDPKEKLSKNPKGAGDKVFLDITDLTKENPHEIEQQMLKDWLIMRKYKRSPVTHTAWNRINTNLSIIKQQLGMTPHHVFETMVTSGWLSLELKYFQTKPEPEQRSNRHMVGNERSERPYI